MPVRAGTPAVPTHWLSAGLMLSLLLALLSLWYWKRRTDQALQRSELSLAESRRQLLACREHLGQLAAEAERAGQVARSERERLAQALFDREQRLDLQLDGDSELFFTLDLDGRIRQLSHNWREALGVETVSLIGQNHAWLLHPDDLPACQGAIERALASRSAQANVEYRIRHVEGDWRWHAARIAPLSDAGGRMVGLLGASCMLGSGLRSRPQAYRKAHFDALTGLPGSHLCLDRLQQALRQAERHANRAAMLLVKLEGFRQVNESLGHAVGDLVLLESAARISASVRASDTVGRGSGATFVVLLPDIGSEREVLGLAHRIRAALTKPLQIRNKTIDSSASIGAAVYPLHGEDEAELVAQAERALQLARQGEAGPVVLPVAIAIPGAQAAAPVT